MFPPRRALGSLVPARAPAPGRQCPGGPILKSRRIVRLTPLDRVLADLERHLVPVAPQPAPVTDAVSLVLAEPLVVPAPVPAAAVAARDGYAVASEAVLGAGPAAPVFLAERPASVESGIAMPAGADAVVPPDALAEAAGLIELAASAAIGEGVRPRGYDAREGEVLVARGRRPGPLAIAAALACGIAGAVVRRPFVRILVVGEAAAIERDVSGRLVADLLAARGAALDDMLRLPDDPAAIAEALAESAADLIVTVGGTGEGSTDRTCDGVAAAGTILHHGIAIAPGETSAVGIVDSTPVLLLPGRPDAALAGLALIGRPMLDRLAGAAPEPVAPLLPLAAKLVSTIGMTELHLVAVEAGRLVPLGGAGLPLGRLARADGFVVVPPGSEGWPAGTAVAWHALPTGRRPR